MNATLYQHTGLLSRLILHQERIRISLWLIGIVFFTLIVPPAFTGLYSSQQERDIMAETMWNPAMTAMVGPGNLENYTIGAMTAHQMLLLTALVTGLMNVLFMARHTRSDEEDGRMELIRSMPVGRLASLGAAFLVSLWINLLLGAAIGFGLFVLGIDSMGLEGSLLYGAVIGSTGLFLAALTAVFAQLAESSRGTVGLSITFLLMFYIMRAIGDVTHNLLSILSPLGWVPQAEVYTENFWWPVWLLLGLALLLFLLANRLNAIRDLGSGFLPSRPGRKQASALLLNPIGLAFRLQRTTLISWGFGMLLMGLTYGSILGDLDSFFEGNDMLQQIIVSAEGFSLSEQFIPMLMFIMVLLCTVPAILSLNKLYSEEKRSRIEHIVGRAVSRTRLFVSYLVISLLTGWIMLSLSAIGLWAAGTLVVEGGMEFWTIYGAGLAYYPAMAVMLGLSALLIGFEPKLTVVVWIYLIYSFLVLYLGGLFDFPEWVEWISPYGHIPQLPIDEFSIMPILLLLMLAAAFNIVGILGYQKRDLEG